MPQIISSTTLRNEYNRVVETCHKQLDPVFITRNGAGDLAVMSIEAYETLARRAELVEKLAAGRADAEAGNTIPADEAIAQLYAEFA